MYKKKKTQRQKKRGKKYTRKHIKNGGTPPRVWSQLSRKNQSLCIKKYPEDLRKLGNECYKYDDKLWIRTHYDMNDVTDELAPLHIFNEPINEPNMNNYDAIEDGIHNFMLFWADAEQKYTLVTSYFNAFEFGSKHNIISLRSIDKTPDTFIISGEIKKKGKSIHFHDTSSQYFRQECNLKRRAPVIYLYDLINKNSIEIDEDGDIADFDLDFLKRTILNNNTFNAEFKSKLTYEVNSFEDLKDLLLEYFPLGKLEESDIARDYITLIQNILADAFQRIFHPGIRIDYVTVFKEEEYGEQKNVKKMTERLCPGIPFEVYNSQVACKTQRVRDKKPFYSCDIENESSSSPKSKRQRKN
jgi:hypothetical protein